jgi:hypothetical protein
MSRFVVYADKSRIGILQVPRLAFIRFKSNLPAVLLTKHPNSPAYILWSFQTVKLHILELFGVLERYQFSPSQIVNPLPVANNICPSGNCYIH